MARSNQTQHSQETSFQQTFIPIGGSGPTVSFPGAIMHVGGQPQEVVRVLEAMSSNQLTKYTAIIWRDPNTNELRTSCNCNGWAMKRGTYRTCKHVQELQDNPLLGRTLGEAQAAATQSSNAVTPRTREIIASVQRTRSVMLD